MQGFAVETPKTSKEVVNRFYENIGEEEVQSSVVDSTTTEYFYSSQYKHFDKFDPSVKDDVILDEQLGSLLTYLTEMSSLDVSIIKKENEVLKMVKRDIVVEIQSILIEFVGAELQHS